LELDSSKGKIVWATTGDFDEDTIIDSQDFDGIAEWHFVPMALRLSENVSHAEPSDITVSFEYDCSVLRIWKPDMDAPEVRDEFDDVCEAYSEYDLGLSPGEDVVVLIEALGGASNPLPITVNAHVTGSKWSGTLSDKVHVIAANIEADLDTDSNNNGAIDGADDPIEADTDKPGRVVVLNNDDDNANRVVDSEEQPVQGENNLAELALNVLAEGDFERGDWEVRLRGAGEELSRIRLWEDPQKNNEVTWQVDPEDGNGRIATWSLASWNGATKTLWAEGLEDGDVFLELAVHDIGPEPSGRVITDRVKLLVTHVDLDIDSDNDGAVEPDDAAEDALELDDSTGKIVWASTGDFDGDGIQDLQDFGGIGGWHFAPMELRLAANVSQAYPTEITVTFEYDCSALRIWKPDKDAPAQRDELNHVCEAYSAYDDLGLQPGGSITVYVEALRGVTAPLPITAKVHVTGSKWTGMLDDMVHVVAVNLDVDVDSDNNNGLDQPERSDHEDEIEDVERDPTRPGKLMDVNDTDLDRDAIPDLIDGFDLDGLPG